MEKFTIDNAEVQSIISGEEYKYPKYATQIMNLANQNAQGTRPKIVGQMSELINEFQGSSIEEWKKWYQEGYPNAIDDATERVYNMVEALKVSIKDIDKKIVKKWVEELIYVKTYVGLKFQDAIIKKIAEHLYYEYKFSIPADESKGIDGYINGKPVSIKPTTYKVKSNLSESIDCPIVFYEKKKSGITVEYDKDDFR